MKLTKKPARGHGAPAAVALAAAIVAALPAGCGGGASSSAGVARLSSSAVSSSPTAAAPANAGSSSPEAEALAFARCMRANGLPGFPDPAPGGGFLVHRGAGLNPSSPAFEAAQAKCKKFNVAPPTTTHPAAKVLARFLAISRCMRARGVYGFPDPRTSVPPNAFGSGGAGVISDIEEVIFVFPRRIDMGSPQFTRAAAKCAFPLHNH